MIELKNYVINFELALALKEINIKQISFLYYVELKPRSTAEELNGIQIYSEEQIEGKTKEYTIRKVASAFLDPELDSLMLPNFVTYKTTYNAVEKHFVTSFIKGYRNGIYPSFGETAADSKAQMLLQLHAAGEL